MKLYAVYEKEDETELRLKKYSLIPTQIEKNIKQELWQFTGLDYFFYWRLNSKKNREKIKQFLNFNYEYVEITKENAKQHEKMLMRMALNFNEQDVCANGETKIAFHILKKEFYLFLNELGTKVKEPEEIKIDFKLIKRMKNNTFDLFIKLRKINIDFFYNYIEKTFKIGFQNYYGDYKEIPDYQVMFLEHNPVKNMVKKVERRIKFLNKQTKKDINCFLIKDLITIILKEHVENYYKQLCGESEI